MKKWEEPQITDLSLKETKGGPVYSAEADGPAIYDHVVHSWWTPSGYES